MPIVPRGNLPLKKNQRRKQGIAKGTHINKAGTAVVRNVGKRTKPVVGKSKPRY